MSTFARIRRAVQSCQNSRTQTSTRRSQMRWESGCMFDSLLQLLFATRPLQQSHSPACPPARTFTRPKVTHVFPRRSTVEPVWSPQMSRVGRGNLCRSEVSSHVQETNWNIVVPRTRIEPLTQLCSQSAWTGLGVARSGKVQAIEAE